jgi:hypothetical protein
VLQSARTRARELEGKAAQASELHKEREVLLQELQEKDGIIDILREHVGGSD